LAPLRSAAPSRWISRADCAQGALAKPLDIALARFRKCDDALRKLLTKGVVKVGGGAERGQRHLKGNAHKTDRFAVELLTAQVGPDWHESGSDYKAALITLKFHSTKIPIVKSARRRNRQTCPAFTSGGRWNAFVSDLAKREGTLACPRCKGPMNEVVWIAPLQGERGLIAYECPSCGYVTSVLISPKDGEAGSGPL
jgi:hypothetical protein